MIPHFAAMWLTVALLLAACGGAAGAGPEPLRVCWGHNPSSGNRQAATAGLEYWNAAAEQPLFVPATDDCDVTIEIGETAGDGHVGEYHRGRVVVTANYAGWWPTYAHEMGHALGLDHVTDAAYLGVMKPVPFAGHLPSDAELLARSGT